MDPSKGYCHSSQTTQQNDVVSKNKTQLNSTSSNYINVVPGPMGVQYHRRKLAPQDYQSRLYYNNGDYLRERCRDDYFTSPNSATTSNSSSSTSHQQQLQQHHQTQSDLIGSRVVATQTNNCDQIITPIQPVVYTVHRVVTTAQIQTANGGSFATSSSVSSVVSAVCGETDALTGSTTLCSSPGLSTNSNYQSHQVSNSDLQQATSCLSNSYGTASTSNNYNNSGKSSQSISRPLQNVIPTCVYLMSRIAVHMEIEGTEECPSQVMLAAALGCEELGIANKLLAQSIFGLWMTSTLLEIQLKSHHRPYVVRVAWPDLLEKFSQGNPIEKKFDEPMIVLKRNVFFSKKDEEKIKDPRILELLYEEAKYNVLSGRYVMESVHSIMLGGIQARIELGPYNSHTHTVGYFRENQLRFLPQHVAKNSSWSWLPISQKSSAEVKLLEQYRRVPQAATTRKLMRKYLEFCWALPFYGAAFFHGQVEQPVRGLMSLVNHKDISVIIGINERGVFVIDPVECTLLLGLRYEDVSWDFAKPSSNDDPDCQTCIFLQFDALENGIAVSKLMQIFSRQAAMMDALIANFTEQMRKTRGSENFQGLEYPLHEEPNPIQNNGTGVLCNKLSRLTLATYDDEGRCIGQMGSLSISY